MNADAEPAADIAPGGVAVDRGENPHRVEDQQLPRTVGRAGRALRVAQRAAFGFGHQPCDTRLVHFVGGDDEFHVGIVVYQPDQQLFIRLPCRSGHEQAVIALEAVDDVDASGRAGDLRHAVEARVPGHQHVVEAQRRQQFFRLLVLHEHHVERLQRLSPHAAVGAEKDRIAAEDGRHDVGADFPAAQFAEQVEPVLVFDEDGDFGVRGVEEAAGVARRVDREVEDVVDALVVLADFVARRREEGQKNLVFGVRLAKLFDDGAALFELSERRDVYPDDPVRGGDCLPHAAEEVFAAFDPKAGLRMAWRHETDGPNVENQTEIIEPHRYLRC